MTVSITDLNATENYEDDHKLTEALLKEMVESIESYINTYVVNNLEQLAKDAFSDDNYTFGNDGSADFTNSLFDKQYGYDSYNGGDISIGTSASSAWAAVDAVNAAIAFTPEKAGVYKVTFNFTHRVATTAATEGETDVGFRITDGSTASAIINSGAYLPATASNSGEVIHPISITMYFDWTATAKTVTLQYYNRTCTSLSANQVAATAATGEIGMIVEKI